MTTRRDDQWLARWMKAPDAMLKTYPAAKAMLAHYKVPMPNLNLSDLEIAE